MLDIIDTRIEVEGNYTYKIEKFIDGTEQKILINVAKTIIGAEYTDFHHVGDMICISIIVASEDIVKITDATLIIDGEEHSVNLMPSSLCENCKVGYFEFITEKERYEVIIKCEDANPLILNLEIS